MNYAVTPKGFELFKRSHREWMQRFGLGHWTIHYLMPADVEGAYAESTSSPAACQVVVRMSRNWGSLRKPTSDQLRKIGLHEAIHSLLAAYDIAGRNRWQTEDEFKRLNEDLTTKLEEILHEHP